MTPQQLLESLYGSPHGVVSLAPLPGGRSPQAGAAGARLWLPADLMFAWKLAAGAPVVVAVVGAGPAAAGAAAAAPGLQPLSLRHLYQQQLGVPSPSSDAQQAGDLVVPAELWPAPRLARGTAAASQALQDSLGRPGPGTQLAVYSPAGEPPQQQHQPECATALLRLCTMQRGTFAPLPAVLPRLAEETGEKVAVTPAGGAARPRAPEARQPSPSPASPAMRAGGGTPVALSPAMRAGGRQPAALSPAMRGSGSGTPVGLSRAVGGQTPQTPKSAGPGSEATTASGSGGGGSGAAGKAVQQPSSLQAEAVLALLQEAGAERSRLWGLLEELLRRQLCGRRLLPGNFVAAPVLGQQVLFRVERLVQAAAVAPAAPSGGLQPAAERQEGHIGQGCGRGEGAGALLDAPIVTPRTKVQLLGPGGEDPADGSREGGSVSAAPGGGFVEAAAEAAAEAVGGGSEGPAARAAARAAATGTASMGVEFAALGGAAGPKQALQELVALPLRAPQLFAQYQVAPPRGILLYGPPGTGKTVLARAACAAAGARLFVVNGPDVVSEYYGESEGGLRGVFAAARALAPSVIFIDELDAIAPSRGGAAGGAARSTGAGSASGRLVTTLLGEMDALQDSQVVLVAATNRPDVVDPALRRPGRIDREVEVGVPSPADRRDILNALLVGMRHKLTEHEVTELADAAHGFVPADLGALCNEAALAALRRVRQGGAELHVTPQDFAVAETRVRPSAMREVAVEVPKVRWEDIGGVEEAKQSLKEAVEWPFRNPEALSRLGAQAPKGILLHGPPGCSKTLLARAVASQARLNFLAVKGPELYSKYVGESEKAVATLFARARAASPSIIFFDELDGLAVSRDDTGDGGANVAERVLSQLLQEMDGLQARQNVIVIAATNRLECIDPALTRPGRFDRLLFIPPPDATARRAILQVHTRKMPLADDVNLEDLAATCKGYSGADIAALCREAAMAALERDLAVEMVSVRDFKSALDKVHPTFTL